MVETFEDVKKAIFKSVVKEEASLSLDKNQTKIFFNEALKEYPSLGQKFIETFYSKISCVFGSDASSGFTGEPNYAKIAKELKNIKPITLNTEEKHINFPFDKSLDLDNQKVIFDSFIKYSLKGIINTELRDLISNLNHAITNTKKIDMDKLVSYILNPDYAVIMGSESFTKVLLYWYKKSNPLINQVKFLSTINTQPIVDINTDKIYCYSNNTAFSIKSDPIFKFMKNNTVNKENLDFSYNYALSLDHNINANIFQIEDK